MRIWRFAAQSLEERKLWVRDIKEKIENFKIKRKILKKGSVKLQTCSGYIFKSYKWESRFCTIDNFYNLHVYKIIRYKNL
eukprot:UN33283